MWCRSLWPWSLRFCTTKPAVRKQSSVSTRTYFRNSVSPKPMAPPQKIEAARLELAAPAARQANSDAAAISAYLSALGWSVHTDTLNKLLALLAVLVIELGGGASLAIGMALSQTAPRTPSVVALSTSSQHQDTAEKPANLLCRAETQLSTQQPRRAP